MSLWWDDQEPFPYLPSPAGAPGTGSYVIAHALAIAKGSIEPFTPGQLEFLEPGLRPFEIAYLIDTLNAIPSRYRFQFIEERANDPSQDLLSLAYTFVVHDARARARRAAYWNFDWSFDGSGFWGAIANLGGFALGVGLGGAVGYGATWLGASVGGSFSNVLIGTIVQLAITTGTAYGAAALGEGILTDFGNRPMSDFGQWLMTGAYGGGIVGGAYYVWQQIPPWTIEFGIGYRTGWFDELTQPVYNATARAMNTVFGTGMPYAGPVKTSTDWWWRYIWKLK